MTTTMYCRAETLATLIAQVNAALVTIEGDHYGLKQPIVFDLTPDAAVAILVYGNGPTTIRSVGR